MKRMITALLAVTAWVFASGQEAVWSLDSCIAYATTHSGDIRLADAQLLKSQAQLKQAIAELFPTLNLYVNQYYNWGRSVDMQELVIVRNRLTQQTSASIGASFSIFDGFARINTAAANHALSLAAKSTCDQTLIEAKADITRAYLGWILSWGSVNQLQMRLMSLQRQIQIIEAQIRCGERSLSDLLEMEAKAADIRNQIAQAEAEGASQMHQLKKSMGCSESFLPDPDYYKSVLGTDTACCTPGPELLLPDGELPALPAIDAARQSVQAARFALKSARGASLPTLSLTAAYGSYYSDAAADGFKEQIDGNQNPSVSLSLVIPIFDGGSAASKIAQAKAELEQEQIKLRQTEEDIAAELEQMVQQCRLLAQQEQSSLARKELCKERMRICDEEFALGTISCSDWIEACDNLAQSESDLLQCRCKYLFQMKIIEYYYGRQ